MANRRGEIEEIYFATRTVVLTDYMLTLPAVLIQLITGILLVQELGRSFTEFWIAWGLALYFFAGACWIPVVWMQIRMRDMAKISAETNKPLPGGFWKMDRWWIILGSLAFPSILIVFYLMVFKPMDGFFS